MNKIRSQFGFNLEPHQNRFLAFYSAQLSISKAEILRRLIDDLIDQNQGIFEYSEASKKSSP